MNPGSAAKLDKRNTAKSKKLDDGVMPANSNVFLFFRIMGNLEQSESRISNEWSVKLIFSLIFINPFMTEADII